MLREGTDGNTVGAFAGDDNDRCHVFSSNADPPAPKIDYVESTMVCGIRFASRRTWKQATALGAQPPRIGR
jgi:hypothetical protein